MPDLVIRDAKIIDGTGAPAFNGDIAVTDGVIVEVGKVTARGRREIAANGQLATPGWVDIHSHYDGQVMWDPYLSPSSWHGCTSVIMGNCGVGFAPARACDRDRLMRLMEGVEDIPGIALAEGLKWNWESFPSYLDAVDAAPHAIDVGAQLAHAPLRIYAMGERGARQEPATADDIALMRRLVVEAIDAGALGVSTSRYLGHRSSDGELVPGTYADTREIAGILDALAGTGRGFFQFVAAGDMPQREFLDTIDAYADRVPMSMNLQQTDAEPDGYRKLLARFERIRDNGGRLYGLVHGRTTGILLCLDGTMNPFSHSPAYAEIADLPLTQRVEHLRQANRRAAILSGPPPREDFAQWIWTSLKDCYELGDPPDYEPAPASRFDSIAAATGRTVAEVAYDALLQRGGKGVIYYPTMNYSHGDLDATLEMLEHPLCRLGLADGGAHCGFICDVSLPTYMLTHWVRDRTRGRRVSLEWAVKIQTQDTAQTYGLLDRGVIAPGYKADLNIIDFGGLRLHAPQIVADLPAGGKRFVQRADGYAATICSGEVAFEHGEATGAMPGRLIRGRRHGPS
jgi:N-acyl-D-aspartate/D-glutamate deacylase